MESNLLPLTELEIGKSAIINSLKSIGNERRGMLDLGIVNGTKIEALYRSPSGDPVAYNIRGAVIALRSEDAKKILINKEK